MPIRVDETAKGEKKKASVGNAPSKGDLKHPAYETSDEGAEPSNVELMEMLCGMKCDITETKEIKTELATFRTKTFSSMAALKTNVQGLGENQKSIESSIDSIKKEQDSLVKKVKTLATK